MRSSWFQEPVHKRLRWFSAILIVLLTLAGFYERNFWWAAAAYAGVWHIFLLIAAFNIRSGVFVKTHSTFSHEKNGICITFDDGPGKNTGKVLDILKSTGAKASFFCIGSRAANDPSLVKKMTDQGHTVGNHTLNHQNIFPLKKPTDMIREIETTQDILEEITGRRPRFFRPPFGITNPLISEAMSKLNMQTVGWSIRSLDTVGKSTVGVLRRIDRKLTAGSILLLHDNLPGSDELLIQVIELCRKKNLYTFTLDEVL